MYNCVYYIRIPPGQRYGWFTETHETKCLKGVLNMFATRFHSSSLYTGDFMTFVGDLLGTAANQTTTWILRQRAIFRDKCPFLFDLIQLRTNRNLGNLPQEMLPLLQWLHTNHSKIRGSIISEFFFFFFFVYDGVTKTYTRMYQNYK
jgi:hypothetical protein